MPRPISLCRGRRRPSFLKLAFADRLCNPDEQHNTTNTNTMRGLNGASIALRARSYGALAVSCRYSFHTSSIDPSQLTLDPQQRRPRVACCPKLGDSQTSPPDHAPRSLPAPLLPHGPPDRQETPRESQESRRSRGRRGRVGRGPAAVRVAQEGPRQVHAAVRL